MTAESSERVLFEHRFWLQVLGDHSRFFLKSLGPSEKEEISRTLYFIHEFDSLLALVRKGTGMGEVHNFHNHIWQRVQQLKDFKLHLISRQLEGQIRINLEPSLISHMVNELEEYQTLLSYIVKGETVPLLHPTHYHLLWLLDAIGHADTITISLDVVEASLRNESQRFTKDFEACYRKAHEISGLTRAIRDFSVLKTFNHEAANQIQQFIHFLTQLLERLLNRSILGMLDPLMPDHMLREECYYLTKLSLVTDISSPSCDPGRARIMEKL
ncbi:DUF2935 domain-containing protein [Desulfosporosinus sp. FKA]|uniref:DUF2935 domain-containing protein n=1 Tax=Desulfosporosinus sp. FKA TaxID=1969834 RepID=UPI000B4A3457|nr:DUF2935 domain-containing protein [Desulfosporosinus sp. FKA]